LQFLGILKDYN